MKRERKVGIFIAITLFILIIFIFIVGDLSVFFKKSGYALYSFFDSTAGLEKRAVVRVAGVKVGYVKDIRLKENRAEIEMSIDNKVRVKRGSKATIASLGLVGEKYIEIFPGEEDGFYEPGEVIEGLPSLSLDQVGTMLLSIGNEVKSISQVLKEILEEEEPRVNFREILQNLSSFSSDLRGFFEGNRGDLDRTIEGTANAVENFDKNIQ